METKGAIGENEDSVRCGVCGVTGRRKLGRMEIEEGTGGNGQKRLIKRLKDEQDGREGGGGEE